MATLTAQRLLRAGLTPNFAAATTAGDSFINDGRTMFRWKNTSAGIITVTIPVVTTVDGQVVTSRTVTLPATTGDVTTDVFPSDYNDAAGQVNCTYSTAVGVTVAAIQISKLPGT